jgi:hypothetical protein
MVRRIALAGSVLVLGLTACGTSSRAWSGPRTEVNCAYVGKQATLEMVMDFAPGATSIASAATPTDLAGGPGYEAIVSQPDPSSAARVAETYGWSCSISTP